MKAARPKRTGIGRKQNCGLGSGSDIERRQFSRRLQLEIAVGHSGLLPDRRDPERASSGAPVDPSFLGLALSALLAHPLCGSDVETQHAFDVTLHPKPTLDLVIHSRIRTQPGGLGFYQVRAGPILSSDATHRISLLSGYYYAQQEWKIDNDIIGGHRLLGGAEVALLDRGRLSLEQRFLAERFLSDAADDFNRYRLRTRLSATYPVAPYTTHELFFDARGWRSNRHSAGVVGIYSRPWRSIWDTFTSTVGPG